MPILFALTGATGIGKSQLSLSLAERFDAELIGMDSRQIYKGFAIGTAQPPICDRQRVRHHLVDFLSPEQSYSAGEFVRDVKRILDDNPSKNFILVGGTGLYLQALVLGLPKIPKADVNERLQYERVAEEQGVDTLYKMALDIDPESVQKMEGRNVQKIIRILEVWKATGEKLSELQKKREGGIGEIPVFWLNRSRENLYARINARVDKMMEAGWLQEIQELAKVVPIDAPAWQSLGYRELLSAGNDSEIDKILEEVKKKTRNYAKRQLTWFRWQVKSTSIDLDIEKNAADLIEKMVR